MKVFFRNIHLYLSLAAGMVIMTCCFTGAILVFEKELQEIFHKDRYFVKQQGSHLSIEQLVANIKQQYPQAKIASVKIYPDPTRSVEIGVGMPSKDAYRQQSGKRNASPPAGGGRATHTVFVNPYTGQIIELYNYRETFFYTMFALHRWLLGGENSIGKTITGVSTFIFLFILITGIILWWPKNKAILMQRLKIKTNANWKRINHDLHIVLGFYAAIFLFIFAFTALAWSFEWFNNGIYTITNSTMETPKPPHSNYVANKKSISYDVAFTTVIRAVPDAQYYTLRAPNDSTGIFTATALPISAMETASDSYYIDQYSGKLIGSLQFEDKNLGQRVRSTFKPVHVGSIYGLPSKILAFFVCLFGASFPITGTIMWINRLRKRKKQLVITVYKTVPVTEDEKEES
jgi:uncharacterized iron-regulated membrane protein